MSRTLLPRLAPLSLILIAGVSAPLCAEVPAVVTDIAPVQSLVAMVMGELGTPAVLVRPGASPHGYALRPSDAAALQAADLVVWVGPGLTPWLSDPIATLAPDAQTITLSATPDITVLPLREGATFEAHDHDAEGHAQEDHADDQDNLDDHGDHDHDAHDDHAHEGPDPHVWLDPENGQVWLSAIADRLASVDPENAATYAANATEGRAVLDRVIARSEAALAPVHDRAFITFHDAYQYFEARFGLAAAGSITFSDASPASAARIAEIRQAVADLHVTCIFTEPQFSPALVATVLDGSDARSASLDPLGIDLTPGPMLYGDLIGAMAQTMADCLS